MPNAYKLYIGSESLTVKLGEKSSGESSGTGPEFGNGNVGSLSPHFPELLPIPERRVAATRVVWETVREECGSALLDLRVALPSAENPGLPASPGGEGEMA